MNISRKGFLAAAGYQEAGFATAKVHGWMGGDVEMVTFIRSDHSLKIEHEGQLKNPAPGSNGNFRAVKLTPADFVYPVYRGPEGDAGCDPTGASLAQEDREYVNKQCENQGLPPRFGPGAQVSGIGLFYTFNFQN